MALNLLYSDGGSYYQIREFKGDLSHSSPTKE